MGEIEIAGKDAARRGPAHLLERRGQAAGGAGAVLRAADPQGTFVDDLLVYRLGPAHFLLVVNAGNIAKDYAWMAGADQGRGRCGGGRLELALRA